MVQIAGKYKLDKNVNFLDFLLKLDIPQAMAEKMDANRPGLNVKIDGDKITVEVDGLKKATNVYVLGKEVDETVHDTKLKSVATLNGNAVTIASKNLDGTAGLNRVYTFSDSGVEVQVNASNGAKATRIYKRV